VAERKTSESHGEGRTMEAEAFKECSFQ